MQVSYPKQTMNKLTPAQEKRFDEKFKPFGFDLDELFGGTSGVTTKLGDKLKQHLADELTAQKEKERQRIFKEISKCGRTVFGEFKYYLKSDVLNSIFDTKKYTNKP